MTLHPFLSPVGMRCAPSCSGAGKPTPVGAGLQSWPGGVPPHPFLSPVGMRCAPSCSGAGKPTPVGAGLQSWPSGVTLVRCPDGHTLFALRHTTKLCSVTSCCKNSPETGEFCFVSQPFLWRLAPTGPRREARKGSGKNLVFPRGTAAASPNDLQVILALCQNNTPPMAQEGPGGFRRREETWGSLPRREGSAPISPGALFPFWRFRLPLP